MASTQRIFNLWRLLIRHSCHPFLPFEFLKSISHKVSLSASPRPCNILQCIPITHTHVIYLYITFITHIRKLYVRYPFYMFTAYKETLPATLASASSSTSRIKAWPSTRNHGKDVVMFFSLEEQIKKIKSYSECNQISYV